jgi:hypothetical protein
MVKPIYTWVDLQPIISKHYELLSAQHHTLIARGCLTFFCFVLLPFLYGFPCLFAKYVLIVTGSTCTVVPIQKDHCISYYIFAWVISSSGQVLYLHKMCPQARLLYLIKDITALVRPRVQLLPSYEQINHQFTTDQKNKLCFQISELYGHFLEGNFLVIECKYLQFRCHG